MKKSLAKAVLALATGLAINAVADDWPQWRGPNRDGVWAETGIMRSFPKEGLKISWRVSVGTGWSSPIVANGRVCVTDVEMAGPKSWERVLCLDEASGKQLWFYRYEAGYPQWALNPDAGGPRATPIVQDSRLFTLGSMGRLLCLDAVSGQVIWEIDLAKDYGLAEFSGITASPLIEGGMLILYMCGKPGACVTAFDKNSGKEIWRALDDAFSYSSLAISTVAGAKQLIVWTQEAITSLNPGNGQTWWRQSLRTPGDMAISTPVFSDHLLLIGGLMMKLDSDKPGASILWPESLAPSKRVLSNTSTALIQNGCVYSAKTSGELVCLETETGRQLWETNSVTDLKNGSSIHLTPNGDSVFLFTNEGNLVVARLSPAGYQELGRAHLIDPTHPFNGRKVVWPPPAYANRHIFVRSDKELVSASLALKN